MHGTVASITSIYMAASSLAAQQNGLNTTAHNLSNVNTVGYVRQQVIFKDYSYSTIGRSANSLKQVGLGTSVQNIRQVRDTFLDASYRNEMSRFSFYEAQTDVVTEIENIFGEIDGESFAQVTGNLWNAIQQLKTPEGLENRGLLVQSASLFVDRVNLIGNQLNSYQVNLNKQVTEAVKRINAIGQEIVDLNNKISKFEITGARANDYRDVRNGLLDELATYGEITYRELPNGELDIMFENISFISESSYNKMDVREAANNSGMVKPYWVSYDSDVIHLDREIGQEFRNDTGKLKGILLGRGTGVVNYTAMQDSVYYNKYVEPSLLMSTKSKFDNLVHSIVTKINDILAPNTTGTPAQLDTVNAPYGLDGSQGIELFKREYRDRYDSAGNYIEENPSDPYTLYSTGNLIVNPVIDQDYNKLCLNYDKNAVGDARVVEKMLEIWQTKDLKLNPDDNNTMNIDEYYYNMMYEIAQKGEKSNTIIRTEQKMINQIENQRQSIMGVSSDEELGNMMKYQHAYNAGARVLNTLSEMLEHVIMHVGRA